MNGNGAAFLPVLSRSLGLILIPQPDLRPFFQEGKENQEQVGVQESWGTHKRS